MTPPTALDQDARIVIKREPLIGRKILMWLSPRFRRPARIRVVAARPDSPETCHESRKRQGETLVDANRFQSNAAGKILSRPSRKQVI